MNQNVTLGHLHAIDADSWNARVAPPNCYGDARSKVAPRNFRIDLQHSLQSKS